jgi:preprotein translocase subunit SecD
MSQRYVSLILILVLLAGIIWIDLPGNPGITIGEFSRTLKTVLGLDLRGGMQVLLLAKGDTVNSQTLDDARLILENRSNGLGVSEVLFQVAGDRRIVGEFPGLTNTDEVLAVLKQTGLLEFVDMGDTELAPQTEIKTDNGSTTQQDQALPNVESTPVIGDQSSPTPETSSPTTTPGAEVTPTDTIWHTVLTGAQINTVAVVKTTLGKYAVSFELKPEASALFAEFTKNNIGKHLAIVMDKKIISSPTISTQIPDGKGEITGDYTYESANNLAIQLRYGSLPVELEIESSRIVGPSLGQDSLTKSLTAGIIGFIIITLFMIIYYRLPGGLAVLSIAFYAVLTLAVYKLLPVTLTLPGIAGFLLSTGGALDANILMFERLKEELRAGRKLSQAIELGWKRAWPSIRDSNIATLITSAILFWFGSAYGATFVKGFALTLMLGVALSLFSAIFLTRTFLNLIVDFIKNPTDHLDLFGL